MGKVFRSILDDDCWQVINTEEVRWLPTMSGNMKYALKPDFHYTARFFVQEQKKDNEESSSVEESPVGAPMLPFVSNVRCILEGKFTNDGKPLSNQLVGILFKYLLDLCNAGHPQPCGIVYNQLEFVFAKFNRNGYLEDCIRCEWATEGSKSLLRTRSRDDTLNFASQALPRGIMSLLNLYGASLSWNSFLGNGASGYVFKIMVERNGTQCEKAMKVVVCSAEDDVLLTVFEANFRAMQSLDNALTSSFLMKTASSPLQLAEILSLRI